MEYRSVGLLMCLILAFPPVAVAASVKIPRTGQTTCYSEAGVVIPCEHTGQDGEKQAGVMWPTPRFTDNGDGSITDNLTGLIWLKNANCTDTVGGVVRSDGLLNWADALAWSNNLAEGYCGLSDHSAAGDWRLPNINELRSLVDYSRNDPDLAAGHPFSNVQSAWYWSSTSNVVYTAAAFSVGLSRGSIHSTRKGVRGSSGSRVVPKSRSLLGVLPVRGGL